VHRRFFSHVQASVVQASVVQAAIDQASLHRRISFGEVSPRMDVSGF